MNDLYLKLVGLTKKSAAGSFYKKSTVLPIGPNISKTFDLFSYNYILPYDEWNKNPESYECRGSVFVDGEMVCRPMKKFFNFGEDGRSLSTKYLHENVEFAMDKLDGSLISSCVIKNIDGVTKKWILKSSGSFESDVLIKANKFINKKENKQIRLFIEQCADQNCTVNMEYIAPDNQIVVQYNKEELKILNVRNIETGEYLYMREHPDEMDPYWVKDKTDFILSHTFDELFNLDGIEGWVIILKDGSMWKFKTKWYMQLHNLLAPLITDNSNALIKIILNGDIDDLRNIAKDSNNFDYQLKKADEFEQHIRNFISRSIDRIQRYYRSNSGLAIKQLAIKITNDKNLEPWEKQQILNLKRGKGLNYDKMIENILRHYKSKLIPDKYKKLTM